MNTPVQIINLQPDLPLPAYGTPMSAGVDLHSTITITLSPGDKSVLIPTGIKACVNDPNFGLFIFPRSGLGHKRGLVLGNGTGVIDADYQGEIFVSACVRVGHESITIHRGDKIAQLVLMPVARIQWEEVSSFDDVTERNSGGFGSTG